MSEEEIEEPEEEIPEEEIEESPPDLGIHVKDEVDSTDIFGQS